MNESPSSQVERYLDRVDQIEGQTSRAELRTLLLLALEIEPNRVIVEIGAYRGRSSAALAGGMTMGTPRRVYAIDPHDHFRGVLGGEFGPADQTELYRNLVATGVGEAVCVISLPSAAAACAWRETNVGLLWIDGDHAYEAVHSDCMAWFPFLGAKAIVAFHDSDTDGVQRAIRDFTDQCKLLHLGNVEHMSWFEWQGDET